MRPRFRQTKRVCEQTIVDYVELDGIEYEVDVAYDVEPYEAPSRDCPGDEGGIEINEIKDRETSADLYDRVQEAGYMETLEERIIETLNSQGDDRGNEP